MLYLLTGAEGYVGSHVRRLFVDNGDTIKELNFDLSENANYTENYGEEYIVVHIAGEKSEDKRRLIRNNIVATSNVINNLVLEDGCKGLVYISSIAVFGIQDGIITENSPFRYENYYGFSKYICEQIVQQTLTDKNWYILRPTNIYSYHTNNVIGVIANSIKYDKEFEVWKSSLATKRNYVHVEDVAEIIYKASKKLAVRNIQKSINIAGEKSYSLQEIIEILENKYGKKLRQNVIDNGNYRGRDLFVDNTLMTQEFGYMQTTNIADWKI